MMASDSVDLGNCDCEPLQCPQSIQPHGAMLVCEADAATIAFVSANAAAVLGVGDRPLLDRSLAEVFGVDVAHELRNAFTKAGSSPVGAFASLRLTGSVPLDVVVHRHDGRFIGEFEPAQASIAGSDGLELAQAMVRHIDLESDVDAIAVAGARLVRTTLGYDRVMVYRFLHNDAGRVIAESKRSDMRSFLGQHLPAADIPTHARRLYLQNRMRVVGDAGSEPVPLLAGHTARKERPIDMSFAHLRGVTPIHCEQLRNLGVAASLSISIVVDGESWGQIVCHHDRPRTLPMPMRVAAELFGQYFSLQLTVAGRRATQAEQRRHLLNDELNHRVKNILAVVKAIAVQTGAHANSVADYSSALEGRLRALSYAHDQSLLSDSRGDLSALLEAEASLHRYGAPDRVKLSGARLALTEHAFSVFALVVHEMMTNAAKYGALSVPAGKLSIEWALAESGDCVVDWSENDGPEVLVPSRRGFGSTLIERSMTYDLGGAVGIDYAVHGVQAKFVIPSRHVVPLPGEFVTPAALTAAAKPLAGLKVLLLEDSALIALDTESTLYRLGASHVDSFPNLDAARQALAIAVPDLAILDFNLGGETSAHLADWLTAHGIPFVFLTGYIDAASIPLRFARVPVIRKPVDIDIASDILSGVVRS